MSAPVDRSRFLGDPEDVVRDFFAPGGPLDAAMGGMGLAYAVNPVQVDYAAALAKAAVRGQSGRPGNVTPIEGSTGVGKSIAILAVSMLTACLTGKPALITTYTRFLNHQIVGRDGAIASAALEIVLGRRPRIALHRPRSAFASPSTCRSTSERMRVQARDLSGGEREATEAASEAVAALGAWAEGAIIRFKRDPGAAGADLDGLIETFVELHPQHKYGLDLAPHEDYALTAGAPEEETLPFRTYADRRGGSDVLVATHAALIRDRSMGGGTLDPARTGYSLVVIDEANRVEDAGQLALGTRRSVASIAREARTLLAAMAEDGVAQATRNRVAAVVDGWLPRAEALLDDLRGIAGRNAALVDHPVTGSEAWLGALRAVHADSRAAAAILAGKGGDAVAGALHTMERRGRDIDVFLSVVERAAQARAAGGRVEGAARREDFLTSRIGFSPSRRDPAIMAVPKAGSRAIALLWNGRESLADAVVVTSATLATPGMAGNRRFASVLSTLNLREGAPNVNFDLAGSFEMKRFGTLREVVLADPDGPLPSSDGGGINPDWVGYVSDGIREAADDVWRADGRNRVVVLANSFADAEAIGEALAEMRPSLIVRGRSAPLDEGFDALEDMKHGVLVTTGAWEGVNRPGLIDHLVIPRLPFTPGSKAFAWGPQGENASRGLEEVSKLLRQGLGRPIRAATDETKVWILDPRIGLPEEVQSREARLPHPRAQGILLAAFPDRFGDAVAGARILPSAIAAAPVLRASVPAKKRKARR